MENNTNNTENNDYSVNLKDSWASFGKGLGRTMAGLGKALIRSARAGIDSLDSETGGAPAEVDKQSLKENWKTVGRSFGDTAERLGKAIEDTVDSVTEKKN